MHEKLNDWSSFNFPEIFPIIFYFNIAKFVQSCFFVISFIPTAICGLRKESFESTFCMLSFPFVNNNFSFTVPNSSFDNRWKFWSLILRNRVSQTREGKFRKISKLFPKALKHLSNIVGSRWISADNLREAWPKKKTGSEQSRKHETGRRTRRNTKTLN